MDFAKTHERAAAALAAGAELAKKAELNPSDKIAEAEAAAAVTEALAVRAAALEVAENSGNEAPGSGGPDPEGTATPFDWQGFGFGVGTSLTIDIGDNKRIGSASLDENGIVRVDDKDSALARISMETHFFGKCDSYIWGPAAKYFDNWLDGGPLWHWTVCRRATRRRGYN